MVLEDRYHDSAQKTRYDCDYTRGVLAGIPTIFDMPLAHVEEIECQVAPEVYGERIWPDTPTYGARGLSLPNPMGIQETVRRSGNASFSGTASTGRPSMIFRKPIESIQEKYDEVKKLAIELETANRATHRIKAAVGELYG